MARAKDFEVRARPKTSCRRSDTLDGVLVQLAERVRAFVSPPSSSLEPQPTKLPGVLPDALRRLVNDGARDALVLEANVARGEVAELVLALVGRHRPRAGKLDHVLQLLRHDLTAFYDLAGEAPVPQFRSPAGRSLHHALCFVTMMPLRARVKNGRLLLDEPTELPDGTEVNLAVLDDDLDDEDRARLHAALEASEEEFKAGKGIPAAEVIAELRRG